MPYSPFPTLVALAFLAWLLPAEPGGAVPEICDNARDDDGDGLVDLNDPDCACAVLAPVSLIPNPSFEEQNCCPHSRSQLNCAKTWIQASEATTDYIHTCGWMGWASLPPPQPIPDGNACVGFRNGRFRDIQADPGWKEYAGACLLAPLRKGTPYRIRFNIGFINSIHSPPTEVFLFGTPDCANLPFGIGNPNYGCPTNGPGWIPLGSVPVSGGTNIWITTEINTVPPEDIYAIAIGPGCRDESATTDIYYFLDNLVLDKQQAFDFVISARGHPCSGDFFLEAPLADTLAYQWYKDGVALPGATGARLPVTTGEGRYQLRVSSPAGCRVLQPFDYRIPRYATTLTEYVCAGERYSFANRSLAASGAYEAALKTANNCDSLVSLTLNVVDPVYDTLHARIFEGETYQLGSRRHARPGRYQARFTSSIGCDSLVELYLDYYHVFFPTAFSPNDDGNNDAFTVFGGADLRAIASLQVFDRWGGLVFSGKDLPPNDASAGWDGRQRGRPAPPGVYVYVARLLMDDDKEHARYGSVVLMR